MSSEVTSSHPIVKAIIGGTAPPPVKMAAARGMLPLPQADLLEVLVFLSKTKEAELAATAYKTLANQNLETISPLLESQEIASPILDFYIAKPDLSEDVFEKILNNPQTPNESIIRFARNTKNGALLELLAFNQQRLIKVPAIIDAILNNSFRTSEADRRATETKKEFFEKERGAEQIANELRAQGKEAAAEFIEKAEFSESQAPIQRSAWKMPS